MQCCALVLLLSSGKSRYSDSHGWEQVRYCYNMYLRAGLVRLCSNRLLVEDL